MSQKSSVPQAISFVSQVLKWDTFYANALRHTWRTIATDCGVDDTLAHLMLGHAPRGVSQGYLSRMVLSSWPAMRAAQRRVSRRIVSLLGEIEEKAPTPQRIKTPISPA